LTALAASCVHVHLQPVCDRISHHSPLSRTSIQSNTARTPCQNACSLPQQTMHVALWNS